MQSLRSSTEKLSSFLNVPFLMCLLFAGWANADQLVYQQTGADVALTKYGLTGKGVVIAIIDRGIQWQNQDFIKADGSTRIKYMLDMSGQQGCSASNPAPTEYTEAQINAALAGGPTVAERDALGHGTVSMGMAAGNGRSFAAGKYTGLAPEADLIVIRAVVEAVPAHDNQPAQAAFNGCLTDAFAWLDQKLTALGEPAVAFINSENTLGPHDGTSGLSALVDHYFSNRPGRAFVLPSGDEGTLADHASGSFSGAQNTVVHFTKSTTDDSQIGMWYSGIANAQVTVAFSDGTSVGPLGPVSAPFNNILTSGDGLVNLYQFFPSYEFFPDNSTSGDHFVYIDIQGHATTGTITISGVTPSDSGTFNIYSDLNGTTQFTTNIAPGHLNDWATTRSATITGASVLRTSWVDINGNNQFDTTDGALNALWTGSNDGPSRDGRIGVSIVSPGHNTWASYATNSLWGGTAFRSIQVNDGGGFYGRGGATSGATPIATGAVALMLQMKPTLTSEQARNYLEQSATTDGFTGAVPNNQWGYGKLNILGALDLLAKCTFTLNAGGESISAQGGSGTIVITAPAGCPWSVDNLPAGITLTTPASGTGTGTVGFTVAANNGGSVTSSFSIGGAPFTIQQQAQSIPGLNFVGSMAHLAVEENWTTTFTLVNKGAAATARLSFFGDSIDPTGNGPLTLPLLYAQQPAGTLPLLGASFDQALAANASLIVTNGGPQTPPVLVGSAQLAATGAVDGFAIFHQIPTSQEAVVPMETRNASSYLLAFDNTNGLVLGVAVENVSSSNAVIPVIIRDETGAVISAGGASISVPGNGHFSFVLSDPTLGFPVTAGKRGTIEFDTPAGGRISVLGLRFTPPNNALTTIPAMANVGTGGGSIAHLASGGDGWQTTFVLVNTGTNAAQFTLSFYNDQTGAPLSLPLAFPQTGGPPATTVPSLTQSLAAGATLVIVSTGAPTLLTGSAQLTTAGHVSGFVIFRHNSQEAIVPLESRNANGYVIAFDNTNGTATGIAVNAVSTGQVNIPVTVRDSTGATLATDTITLSPNGHYAFTLVTDRYPAAANIFGTIEFDTPAGAQIGALGIRIPTGTAHTYTTLPALAK